VYIIRLNEYVAFASSFFGCAAYNMKKAENFTLKFPAFLTSAFLFFFLKGRKHKKE